jgi:hypothetical protein
MAEPWTEKQKKTRLKAANFPPPKQLSQKQVSDICATFGISDQHAVQLKEFLDELIDQIDGWMSQEETANRQRDGKHIENMRKQIDAARGELRRLEIDGRLALRSAAARLADVLSGDWLRYHFPGKAPSKPTLGGVRPPTREPVRGRTDVTYSNYQFVRSQAPETLQALLRDLDAVLASALMSLASDPRARGGQQPLTYRHNVLVHLCEIWHRIGENVVVTPKSNFADFCNFTVEFMGWPTDGLAAAIPRAIKNWRNLRNPR